MAVCQVVTNSFAKVIVYSSAWHNLKMENVMTAYISVEPDGSIKKIKATTLAEATEQYYQNNCSGELHLKIPFEKQPLLYREGVIREVSDFFGGEVGK